MKCTALDYTQQRHGCFQFAVKYSAWLYTTKTQVLSVYSQVQHWIIHNKDTGTFKHSTWIQSEVPQEDAARHMEAVQLHAGATLGQEKMGWQTPPVCNPTHAVQCFQSKTLQGTAGEAQALYP